MADDESTGVDEAGQSTVDTTADWPDGTSSDAQDGSSSGGDAGGAGESGDLGSDSTDSSADSTDTATDPTGTDGTGSSGDAVDSSGDATGGAGDATDGAGDATDGSGDATDSSGDATDGSATGGPDATGGSDATDGSGGTDGSGTDGSGTDGSGAGGIGDTGQDAAGDGSAPDGSADEQSRGTGSASVAADPGPPYLVVDQYPGDSGARPPWETLVSTPGFCGAILKAWDGRQYDDHGWFAANWPAVRDVGGDRYGVSWFRGAYLFVQFAVPGAEQADAYLSAVDRAGGWDRGDIVPIIDVELGNAANPHNTNAKASAQQIVDCATECAQRIKSVTGSRVMLYGRGAMRDRSITSHMGCDLVWNPSYTAKMVTNGLQTWPLEDIALWQYCGDNSSALPGYPHSVAGFAKIDISVYVHGAAKPTLDMLRTSLLR